MRGQLQMPVKTTLLSDEVDAMQRANPQEAVARNARARIRYSLAHEEAFQQWMADVDGTEET